MEPPGGVRFGLSCQRCGQHPLDRYLSCDCQGTWCFGVPAGDTPWSPWSQRDSMKQSGWPALPSLGESVTPGAATKQHDYKRTDRTQCVGHVVRS